MSTPDTPEQQVVGIATKLGITLVPAGVAAAVLAFIFGDHSQQTLGTIAGGLGAVVPAIVLMIGRYSQANNAIKTQGVVTNNTPYFTNLPAVEHTMGAVPTMDDIEGIVRMAVGDALDHRTAATPSAANEPVLGEPTDPSLEVPGGSVPPSETPPEWAQVAS